MAEFINFSFLNVGFVYAGNIISGFNEGDDAISLSFLTDQFQSIAGAKGDVVKTQTNDNRVSLVVKLLQGVNSNRILKDIYNTAIITGLGSFPATIQDKQNREAYFINNLWIMKAPDFVRGQGVNAVEWRFEGADCKIVNLA
jgi:hypothetical protein